MPAEICNYSTPSPCFLTPPAATEVDVMLLNCCCNHNQPSNQSAFNTTHCRDHHQPCNSFKEKYTLLYFHPALLLRDRSGGLICSTSGSHQIPVERLPFSSTFSSLNAWSAIWPLLVASIASRIDRGGMTRARFSEGVFRSNKLSCYTLVSPTI